MSTSGYPYDQLPAIDLQDDDDPGFDIQRWLVKFLIHWPWLVASVLLCLLLAFVYIRYKTPVYGIDGAVLITEDNHTKPRSGTIDLQNLGIMSMTSNFDNEIEILRSRTLIKKVVADLGLYVSIESQRTFAAASPVYKSGPLLVEVPAATADTLAGVVRLEVVCHPDGSCDVESRCRYQRKTVVEHQHVTALPTVIQTRLCDVPLRANPECPRLRREATLQVTILPLELAAAAYASDLSVTPRSKTTTIAQIQTFDTHPRRGVDFVNSLIAQYNIEANDDKNQVAQRTAEFIEERLAIISEDLGLTETRLADFKQQSGLTNLTSDAQLALTQSARYEQETLANATQTAIVEQLQRYVADPANREEALPANVGLSDPSLTALIGQYNSALLDYKRLLRTTGDTNPSLLLARNRAEMLRQSVETTIASVLQNLRIARQDLDRGGSKYRQRIVSAPHQEKEYLALSRQQEIMATLYTLLLQKREENAITLASTANNGRLIEDPMATARPVAPNQKKILLLAFLVGLLLPCLVLYVLELTKYKIENQADVEALTRVPLLAELPAVTMGSENSIVVKENKNGMAEEAFRALRTNLSFMLKPTENVLMLSSTQPGEGKSFVAANTAMSMAILGKHVIVVGLDIRKHGLNRTFGLSRRQMGVTEFLRDPEHADLDALIMHGVCHPRLDVLLGGTIPPNPTELVASDALDQLVSRLRSMYDLVILDTAPIGIVSDSAIIARVADTCLYVCRADFTPKASFQFVNRLADDHKFAHLGIVLNGFDVRKRKNNYARRYGYGYGYGYGSGYGYGYGMDDVQPSSSQQKK